MLLYLTNPEFMGLKTSISYPKKADVSKSRTGVSASFIKHRRNQPGNANIHADAARGHGNH